jgi:hypothetical protein
MPTLIPKQKYPAGDWFRPSQAPCSRGYLYKLIELGIVQSVVLQAPGSKRGVRLINLKSFNDYLTNLAAEQREQREKGNKASEEVANETT